MSRRAACIACGRPLDRHTATCRRCGAAQPHKPIGGTVGLLLMLGLLACALVWVALGRLGLL